MDGDIGEPRDARMLRGRRDATGFSIPRNRGPKLNELPNQILMLPTLLILLYVLFNVFIQGREMTP